MIVVEAAAANRLDIVVALAGPATGVLTAILVTRETSKHQNERDVAQRAHEVAESIRREEVAALDAKKMEHVRRDLSALETFAKAAIGMGKDISRMHMAALRSWDDWKEASDVESEVQLATSLASIYFVDELAPEWQAYNAAYAAYYYASTRYAVANFRSMRTGVDDAERAALQQNARECLDAIEPEQRQFAASQTELLRKITSIGRRRRDELAPEALRR